MDALEGGQSFTVTRDGREIGELIPPRRQRCFVTREEFTATSRHAASVDVAMFREDRAETVGDP
jgi:antitoxin (DNA-binding transcriptional repressor) of toxin-antitoxin stability system